MGLLQRGDGGLSSSGEGVVGQRWEARREAWAVTECGRLTMAGISLARGDHGYRRLIYSCTCCPLFFRSVVCKSSAVKHEQAVYS